jgi:hypothetical protein
VLHKSIPSELNKVLAKILLESHYSILPTYIFGYSLQQTLLLSLSHLNNIFLSQSHHTKPSHTQKIKIKTMELNSAPLHKKLQLTEAQTPNPPWTKFPLAMKVSHQVFPRNPSFPLLQNPHKLNP